MTSTGARPRHRPFGLDGAEYEIDLNTGHAQALRTALARYVDAARRAPGARRPARGGRRASASGLDSTQVRDWAKAQGIDVKDRGRIPAELIVKIQGSVREVTHTTHHAPDCATRPFSSSPPCHAAVVP
jgi:hypothetical protein